MSRKLAGGAVAAAVAAAAATAVAVSASSPGLTELSSVPSANPKVPGFASPNALSPELRESAVAQGSTRLANGTADVPYYGYDGNGPMVPAPGTTAEASKTEPDKNVYLVLDGHRYLFQGHEGGTVGYVTRVDLDTHEAVLLGTQDAAGAKLPTFDGITWDPWAKRLLLTAESSAPKGGVWQATAAVPSQIESLPALGSGGYEGIQNDDRGNLYIVEDSGGGAGPATPHAKQPNSFVYRFLPADASDLTKGGRLQALQVIGRDAQPIVFHQGQPDVDTLSQAQKDMATYGVSLKTSWVTIHDTAVDGTAPFNANALAKTKGATPFKRPENGIFRPGTKFSQFYFTVTGDTNALSEANDAYGGWGGVLRLVQSPTSDAGSIALFYRGDQAHTGLDNIQFLTDDRLLVVEDAGDGLHTQRNALDSGYLLETDTDYATGAQPVRWIAEGRDTSATIDSGLAGTSGFRNDGDNELTGIHVSDGDPTAKGVLGGQTPKPFDPNGRWRVFFTQQHGDNVTYEVTRNER